MIMFECAHINILSKADLVKGEIGRGQLKKFLAGDGSVYERTKGMDARRHRLNEAIIRLVEDFGMVNLLPLDVRDPESVETILSHIDDCTQWAEDQVPIDFVYKVFDRFRSQRNRRNSIPILISMTIMNRLVISGISIETPVRFPNTKENVEQAMQCAHAIYHPLSISNTRNAIEI